MAGVDSVSSARTQGPAGIDAAGSVYTKTPAHRVSEYSLRKSDLAEARLSCGSSSGSALLAVAGYAGTQGPAGVSAAGSANTKTHSAVLAVVGPSYDASVYDLDNFEKVINDAPPEFFDADGVQVSAWMPIGCGRAGSTYRFREALRDRGLLFYTWGNHRQWEFSKKPELTLEFANTAAPGYGAGASGQSGHGAAGVLAAAPGHGAPGDRGRTNDNKNIILEPGGVLMFCPVGYVWVACRFCNSGSKKHRRQRVPSSPNSLKLLRATAAERIWKKNAAGGLLEELD